MPTDPEVTAASDRLNLFNELNFRLQGNGHVVTGPDTEEDGDIVAFTVTTPQGFSHRVTMAQPEN